MSKQNQSQIEYLACPYTPTNVDRDTPAATRIMRARYNLATLATAVLQNHGHVVFSPLTHSHNIENSPFSWLGLTENTFNFWVIGQDLPIIHQCKCLHILRYSSWKANVIIQSRGVQAEVSEALRYDIPIHVLTITARNSPGRAYRAYTDLEFDMEDGQFCVPIPTYLLKEHLTEEN